MNFKTFKQNKLIRDNMIDLMQSQGSKMYWLSLQDKDFLKQLKIKLIEEAQEVIHAKSKDEIVAELADVLEIVHTIAKFHEVTEKELTAIQKKKRTEKGGYEKRIFLTCAEHPKDSPQERYCLANPEKYPEIKG